MDQHQPSLEDRSKNSNSNNGNQVVDWSKAVDEYSSKRGKGKDSTHGPPLKRSKQTVLEERTTDFPNAPVSFYHEFLKENTHTFKE